MDKVSCTSAGLEPAQQFHTTTTMVNSIVSSSSCTSNDDFTLRELIGFPTPHEVHLPVFYDVNRGNLVNSGTMPSLSAYPGFTDTVAKYSSFGSRSLNEMSRPNGMNDGKFPKVLSGPVLEQDGSLLEGHVGNRTNEESSVSEQNPSVDTNLTNNVMSSRKRKGSNSAKDEDGNAKRSKQTENGKKENVGTKTEEGGKEGCKEKALEPQKDYIHVRARRGEATDSHSLAERVRREKISERMKLLQDLVPGCNKVTGKALMLEEIINYVQSLQRQVELMSMKLASVNSELEFNMDNIPSKDMLQQNGIVPQQMYHLDSSIEALYNNNDHQSHQNVQLLNNCNISRGPLSQCSLDHVPLDASLCSNLGIQLPSVDVFSDTVPQFTALGEDDLDNIIQ